MTDAWFDVIFRDNLVVCSFPHESIINSIESYTQVIRKADVNSQMVVLFCCRSDPSTRMKVLN